MIISIFERSYSGEAYETTSSAWNCTTTKALWPYSRAATATVPFRSCCGARNATRSRVATAFATTPSTDFSVLTMRPMTAAAVNDGVAKNLPQNDFRDNGVLGNLNDPEYLYDANSNRTQDKNKNQFTIYNFLNLPETITQDDYTVKYLRDASGRKLAKEVWKGNQLVHVRDYLGPFEYENDTLRRLHHGEVTVRYAYAPGKVTPHWQYRYTDHLGSVRMTYEAAAVQDTVYLCTMEEGKDEEGEYPKFKNVSATRDKVTVQEGDCSSLLIQQQGPFIGIPVRHGQVFDVSVWYTYEPIKEEWLKAPDEHFIREAVIPRKSQTTRDLEGDRKKKPRFSFGITNQARLPQISPRKDKNFLPARSKSCPCGSTASTLSPRRRRPKSYRKTTTPHSATTSPIWRTTRQAIPPTTSTTATSRTGSPTLWTTGGGSTTRK